MRYKEKEIIDFFKNEDKLILMVLFGHTKTSFTVSLDQCVSSKTFTQQHPVISLLKDL